MERAKGSRAAQRHGFSLTALLALGLLSSPGCAMLGGSDPAPSFVTVAVVTRGQSDVDLEADSTGKSALVGGGAGALSAGAVGAGTGAALGLGMGPLAPAAVPVFAAILGAGGAAAGGATGLVVGALQGLPAEKAEKITEILLEIATRRNFQGELRLAVEDSLPEERRGTSDSADATATLALVEVELEQHMSDGVSLHMEATMELSWGPDPQARHSQSWDYEFDSPERHVDEWLRDDGQAFEAALTEGVATIAGQMYRNVRSPSAE